MSDTERQRETRGDNERHIKTKRDKERHGETMKDTSRQGLGGPWHTKVVFNSLATKQQRNAQ